MSSAADDLKGKVCVVTGAAKSIGYAVALKYAENGAKAVLIDIDPGVKESTSGICAKGYSAESYVLDITDRSAVLECFSEIINKTGNIYALVNNAGIVDTRPFEENDEKLFERMFGVNVYGTANCIQGAIESMKKNGEGKIINFSSKSGQDRLGTHGTLQRGKRGRYRNDPGSGLRVRSLRVKHKCRMPRHHRCYGRMVPGNSRLCAVNENGPG